MKTASLLHIACFIGLGTILFSAGCLSPNQQETAAEKCKGNFYIQIVDQNQQSICSDQPLDIQLTDQHLQFQFIDKNMTGSTTISLDVPLFVGSNVYHAGSSNEIRFKIQVKGATDELYTGFEGWMEVTTESSHSLLATFDISLEGYYNKKIIHASGWMKINDSFQ